MGVYVNEDMPKDCYTCFCYETEFNMCSLTGKRLDNIRIRQDDCPLIEIVQCKDCKYGHKHILKDTYDCDKSDITVFHEADFFCKASERRE